MALKNPWRKWVDATPPTLTFLALSLVAFTSVLGASRFAEMVDPIYHGLYKQ